jgi:hypothetical protein
MPQFRKVNLILPTERMNRTSCREVVISTVVAAIAVLVVNGLLSLTRVGDTVVHNLVVRMKWQHILHPGSRVPDLLILGDSSGLNGVSTSVLDSILGTHSWNFATIIKALTLDDAVILGEFIKRHGKPREVLIVHTYDSWHQGVNRRFWANYSLFWKTWKEFRGTAAYSPVDVMSIAAMRALPMTHLPKTSAKYARFPWRMQADMEGINRYLSAIDHSGQFRRSGSQPLNIRKHFLKHLDIVIPAVKESASPISDQNMAGLDRIAELARIHDFPVFLANGPIYKELASDSSFLGAFTGVDSSLTKFAADHRQIYYVDILDKHPMGDLKETVDHLLPHAADRYTSRLANAIGKIRARNQTQSHD